MYDSILPSSGDLMAIEVSEGTSPPPHSNIIGEDAGPIDFFRRFLGIPCLWSESREAIGRPAPESLMYSTTTSLSEISFLIFVLFEMMGVSGIRNAGAGRAKVASLTSEEVIEGSQRLNAFVTPPGSEFTGVEFGIGI